MTEGTSSARGGRASSRRSLLKSFALIAGALCATLPPLALAEADAAAQASGGLRRITA